MSRPDERGLVTLDTGQPVVVSVSPAAGTHAFEQNPEATQVSVCICGKWPDHHVHGADPCGCDACRTPGDATPDAPTEETDHV